ncbi:MULTISPECIES: hypothetical protein [unclassified Micromonospora]|uniref:oxidoreductase n=1 Tax=unclassified Micromonospora TaxID=2617518 RepID=UPI003A838A41
MSQLAEPLELPSGQGLPNRIAKAAMEEFLAVDGQLPGTELATLYQRWGAGGAGLLITGHVMVDERALADPSDVVLADRTPLEPFRRWTAAATTGGARVWMQINHPGRVVNADMPGVAWSASDVPVDAGRYSRFFARPTAMTPEQIDEVVARFGRTAYRAVQAGFDGVQIHAAHGYLLSQFLSPLTNRRTDRWGGDLGNRARLLIDVVTEVRRRLPDGSAVAVKLNTADFQRGGFDPDDARQVVGMLADAGVDLVELSGGSVESLATHGHSADGRTLAREAYFLDAAATIIPQAPVPVMLTGGVRRRAVAERVRAQGAGVVGVATALAVDPELPQRWLRGAEAAVPVPGPRWKDKHLAAAATQSVVRCRLRQVGRGATSAGRVHPVVSLANERLRRGRSLRRYRRWLAEPATMAGAPAAR